MENLNPEDLHHLVEDSFLGGFDDLDGLVPPANNNDANRKTLIQLNERLVKYLENVKSLKKENQNLQTKINELEGRDHHGGDWYQTQILLERIENITKENAEKLLQIKTIKLEKEELNRKLEEETKGEKKLEKELKDLEKNTRLQKQQQENLNEEIEQLKEKFQQQQCNHQTNVKELCEKIKETKVTVEIDSEKSNLAELVRNIRKKYAEIANTNTDEMNNWYKKKLESIQNEEAHNLLELKSAKSKCMQLLRQKKILEIGINALNTTVNL
ncbi:Keratin, type I cytoskeletal 18 [Oryzias melastigma]|uniref:Keratin, type I cytoskeletal 18 n=1 Tax=Oryzias melastigma TaxID=30732 RepID=A0A834FMX6_ORYME|nr:Keratin, type I cytoskeletal 18 [Oryzias melastigma]